MTRGKAAAAPAAADALAVIERELDTSLLVEASAGSGKTHSLVARILALVQSGVAIEHVAAITFTRKAAAELRQRLEAGLATAAANGPIDSAAARALAVLDQAFVGTVHAFCARLLRERPVEAGVDPRFEELDTREEARLREEHWRAHLDRLHVEDPALLQRLADLGVEAAKLEGLYDALCEHPEVAVTGGEPVPAPDMRFWHAATARYLAEMQELLPASVPPKGWDTAQQRLHSALRLWRAEGLAESCRALPLVRVLEELDSGLEFKRGCWPKGAGAGAEAAWEELRAGIVRPALAAWREHVYPQALAVAEPAARSLAERRQRLGRLSYEDLLVRARDLVRDVPHVRAYFRQRWGRLLVDEFQDTDPVQAEVMAFLAAEPGDGRAWRELRLRPGALFVVGDPKQSIYRFRRADIATYMAMRELIERSGGLVLRLTTSYRSVPELVEWTNGVFGELLPAAATAEQAASAPLVPSRPAGGARSGVRRLQWPYPRGYAEVLEPDARAVAAWIHTNRDRLEIPVREGGEDVLRPLGYADVLVLTRDRSALAWYARAMEELSIPYELVGGRGMADSGDLAALAPALRALIDPDDRLAVLAFLRGPLCGADDDALYRFRAAGGSFAWRQEPPPGTGAAIARGLALLADGGRLSRTLPPAAAIARFCERLGIVPYAAAAEQGRVRAGALLRALSLARSLSAQGLAFAEVARALTLELDREERDREEGRVELGGGDAVRIMNLHQAKGLEAPVVFLAAPVGKGANPPLRHIDRSSDPPRGFFLAHMPFGKGKRMVAQPRGWEEAAAAEKRFMEQEELRLLYVAATRAQSLLVVSVVSDSKDKLHGPWAPLAARVTTPLTVVPVTPPARLAVLDPAALAASEEQARAERGAAFERLRLPSYAVTQVTALAHAAGGPAPALLEAGRGPAWGRVLHRLLEALLADEKLDVAQFARNLLQEEERPAEEEAEVLALVAGVRGSELWSRARAAKRRLAEVPFACTVPSSELGLSTGPPETLVRGAADLVFEEADGWVIADYKSDATAGRLEGLAARYLPQIRIYRRLWERMTGAPTRAVLYFIDGHHMIWDGEERKEKPKQLGLFD